jgi:hypothetical protein
MPTRTATVTADTGAAVQNTTQVYNDVSKLSIDIGRGIARVTRAPANSPEVDTDFDIVGVTTVTYTITGANVAIVIS